MDLLLFVIAECVSLLVGIKVVPEVALNLGSILSIFISGLAALMSADIAQYP